MKKLLSPWMALVTLVLLLCIRVADPTFVESVRLRYFDQLITSKGTTTSQQVAVVNIDDAYLQQKGQFPFPRGQYSTLIADLYTAGAGLVVFNIYMPESDRFAQDVQLTKLMKQVPVILPQVAINDSNLTDKHLPFRPGVSVIGGDPIGTGVRYGNIQPNIKQFNETATGIGVVNTLPEVDGVTRRIPMVINSKGLLYPSISLETLRVAAGDISFQVKVNESGIEAVRIPKFGKINTDELGRIWVDWSAKPKEYSAAKLPTDFGGAIVIVGLTAKGLNNPVATSAGAVYPHYLQAAVLETVTSGTNISRPDWAVIAELAFMIVAVILSIYLTRYKHGYVFALALGAIAYYGGFQLFMGSGYLLDAVFPILTILIASFHGYIVKFLVEFNQKQQIKKQFGSYVNPTIVERLQKDPSLIRLGGEKKLLTVVMTDMRNFTALGESYGEAGVEDFTKVMNSYMTALSVPILNNDGTLIKFIGDASLHIHGAPLDDANHAYTAVKTALEMITAVEDFNKDLAALGKPPVGMGAGINTGEIVVGNIGAKSKFGYDVLGDPVSLAARLESQTKGYGVLLIISENTAKLVQDKFPLWELDNIAVKGKTEPVRIFAIQQETEQHTQFLQCYYSGDWKTAKQMIGLCKNVTPEMSKYYDAMAERIADGVAPKGWDGIYRATSK
jgi:adenylate cyclase